MYIYAQINQSGLCTGVSQLSGPVDAANLIPIQSYDESLIGKEWDGAAWQDAPAPEPEPRVLSKAEFILLLRALGMTPAQLVAAAESSVEMVKAAWTLFTQVTEVQRDHPATAELLAVWVDEEIITQQIADDAISSWPVS